MSGLIADSKTMIDRARVEAQVLYMFSFDIYQNYLWSTPNKMAVKDP